MDDDYEELDSFTAGIVRRTQMRQQVLDNGEGRSNAAPRTKRLAQLATNYAQLEDEDTGYVPSYRFATEAVTIQKSPTKMAFKSYDNTRVSDYGESKASPLKTSPLKGSSLKTSPLKKSTNSVSQLSVNSGTRKSPSDTTVNTSHESIKENIDFIDNAVSESLSADIMSHKVVPSNDEREPSPPKIGRYEPETDIKDKEIDEEKGMEREWQKESAKSKKNYVWNEAIVTTLESQGFTKSPSKNRLSYQFENDRSKPESVKSIAEKFNVRTPEVQLPKVKPMEKSSATKRLNEQVLGNQLSKAKDEPFMKRSTDDHMRKTPEDTKCTKNSNIITNSAQTKDSNKKVNSEMAKKPEITPKVAPKVALLQERLFGTPPATTCSTLVAKQVQSRKKEIAIMKEQFDKETNERADYSKELEDRKKEIEMIKNRRTPKKEDHDYDDNFKTNVVNVESYAKETIIEEQISDESIHGLPSASSTFIDDKTAQNTVNDAFGYIDDYSLLDSEKSSPFKMDPIYTHAEHFNAENMGIAESLSPTKSNKLYPQLISVEECDEFHNVSPTKRSPSKPIIKTYQNTDLSVGTPPMRTISFYRREQMMQKVQNDTPPVECIVFKGPSRADPTITKAGEEEMRRKSMEKMIKQMKKEAEEHYGIMNQTSNALSVLYERDEFRGSATEVEAEKHLLISSQKHKVLLNEIQRMKMELSNRSLKERNTKGTFSISNIEIVIKRDYLLSSKNDNEVHHVICLLQCGGKLIATELLDSTLHIKNGKFEFNNHIKFEDLSDDFKVMIEIYDFVTLKERVPNNPKSHSKGAKSLKMLTPKKSKQNQTQSPSLRNKRTDELTIRSSNFVHIGSVLININNARKSCFTMNKCFNYTLFDGTVNATIRLDAEHSFSYEGFLNIFNNRDGCWNRRWSVLQGYTLAFWRNPEDVNDKQSLEMIDLRNCVNPNVSSLPLAICARKNTFALLIACKKNIGMSTVSYMFGADLKCEYEEWSMKLNDVLTNMRLWESDALTAINQQQFERLIQMD